MLFNFFIFFKTIKIIINILNFLKIYKKKIFYNIKKMNNENLSQPIVSNKIQSD